jgi:hypothetical protein
MAQRRRRLYNVIAVPALAISRDSKFKRQHSSTGNDQSLCVYQCIGCGGRGVLAQATSSQSDRRLAAAATPESLPLQELQAVSEQGSTIGLDRRSERKADLD